MEPTNDAANIETTNSENHTLVIAPSEGYAWRVYAKDEKRTLLARGWAINRWVARIAGHAAVSALEKHPERE